LDSRGLIERAKGALMEREHLDEQEAFTQLRRAARSSGRKLTDVPYEVAAGQPLPRGTDSAHTDSDRAQQQG
jgi:AmiR/NasT family two-component response regulator